MKSGLKLSAWIGFAILLAILPASQTLAAPASEPAEKERCPVCGMFVAKYPDWVTQVRLADGKTLYFDGVKDLLVFHLDPAGYGGKREAIRELWAKDYYTMEWLDLKSAWLVIGSDVYGPMGHEFIPFATRAAAENFRKDHHGTRILRLDEVTPPLVQSMRGGQKMMLPSR
ncbi:MAG: nitrous oxide reductase accessory protein NosL [Thermodesulfobacteriota bacterium]